MVAWEYATIRYYASVENILKDSPKYSRLSTKLKEDWIRFDWPSVDWWEEWLAILTPAHAEPELRLLWDSSMTDRAGSIYDVLNELGADGWELVSEDVLSSVVTRSGGHVRAGRPIDVRLWLKRPRSA